MPPTGLLLLVLFKKLKMSARDPGLRFRRRSTTSGRLPGSVPYCKDRCEVVAAPEVCVRLLLHAGEYAHRLILLAPKFDLIAGERRDLPQKIMTLSHQLVRAHFLSGNEGALEFRLGLRVPFCLDQRF